MDMLSNRLFFELRWTIVTNMRHFNEKWFFYKPRFVYANTTQTYACLIITMKIALPNASKFSHITFRNTSLWSPDSCRQTIFYLRVRNSCLSCREVKYFIDIVCGDGPWLYVYFYSKTFRIVLQEATRWLQMYETQFMQGSLRKNDKKIARMFNFTSQYRDNIFHWIIQSWVFLLFASISLNFK
jgi:hypothetical protein